MPPMSMSGRLKMPYFRLLFKLCDKVIVHSREDISYLSGLFYVSHNKFEFIPYYTYEPIAADVPERAAMGDTVLVPGRHRDLKTFIGAAKRCPEMKFVVVGGNDDKTDICLPNVTCHWEVSKAEYNRLFAEVSVVCIPLYKDKYKRSLGQIAILKAYSTGKLVITADIPWIADYISDGTCITYHAEDVRSLTAALQKAEGFTAQERQDMTERAARFAGKFTKANYAKAYEAVMLYQ